MKATLNGIEIEYQDGGQGPAVLLGHGYSATGRMWDGQRAALADRWRVISWDMRGHGQTQSPDDPAQYSAALTVADMRALWITAACRAPSSVASRWAATSRWPSIWRTRRWCVRW
jgi:pimeloyl-ACP methyl ester carboxylesterase